MSPLGCIAIQDGFKVLSMGWPFPEKSRKWFVSSCQASKKGGSDLWNVLYFKQS